MHRLLAVPVGERVDGHLVGHHERGVEAQSEMTDDLVLVGLVLVLLQEILGAGEGDLVDVLLHLVGGHAQAVIGEGDGLRVRIHLHQNLVLHVLGLRVLAHQLQLL